MFLQREIEVYVFNTFLNFFIFSRFNVVYFAHRCYLYRLFICHTAGAEWIGKQAVWIHHITAVKQLIYNE